MLAFWEKKTSGINTLSAKFGRWIYDPVFGPKDPRQAAKFSTGEIRYAAVDKGMIREDKVYEHDPSKAGQKSPFKPSEEPGEHCVGPEWESLTPEKQDEMDLRMAIYAAMIDRVDQNLGRVFAKVKELGEWENTLVMFLTDHGGCPEQPNTTPDIPPGPVESYRTVSVGWANASNTPYRKFKSTDYEGGACTPFIAHWPGVIEPGITEQVGHIIDITPTFMDITGAKYPAEINGNKTKPVAGKSLLPIFKGETREPHETLYWQFGSAKAVREGDWKLVRQGKAPWELYDLKNDRTELTDLAAKYPDRAKALAEEWETWFASHKTK